MIFEYMKENDITNFGYVILVNKKPSLSILLENHEIYNDITLLDDENIYNSIKENEMYIVGITITDEDDNIIQAENLDDNNMSEMFYNMIPLFMYETKTNGLIMQDLVELELINLYFYDKLDEYVQERLS